MPSSRRSSSSAHNLLQSSRRTSHSPKNSTPASVSIIFAEPEQGAPLAPATQVIVSTQPCVHSNDNASTSSRRVTPKPSISSLRTFGSPVQQTDEQHEAAAPEVVMKETEDHGMSAPVPPTQEEAVVDTESCQSVGAVDLTPTPTLNGPVLPPCSVTPPNPSVAPRNSWFGSFARAKSSKSPSKMNIVHSYSDPHSQDMAPLKANGNQSSASLPARIDSLAVDAEEKNSTSHTPLSSPPGPVASFQPIVTASDSTPSSSPTPPCTIPAQPDDTVSRPLQLSTSPLALAASPPPVLNHGSTSPPLPTTTQEFSPSSIDEEVPVVDLSSTLPPTSSISVPANNEAKPSVLNATPSRFAIAIPFLGRTKVPLGNVLKKDEHDNKVEGLPATQIPEVKDIDTSLPQPITIEPFADAARDSLQNAMAHPSESPSITAAEMEPSQDTELEPSLPQSSADPAESITQVGQTQPSNQSWWSYLGWSSAPAPSGPASSISPHGIASMSDPPSSESGLRQSDSRSDTTSTSHIPPLSATPIIITGNDDSNISPKTCSTTPSKGSAAFHNVSGGHANETREGTAAKPTNASGNDVSNATEPETLPRSLDSQERNSEDVLQQQLESAAEQPNVVGSSSPDVVPTTSWFSPWSWYTHPNTQVTVGPSDARGNERAGVEMTSCPDPAGALGEREQELRDNNTCTSADAGKRTGMESDGETQALGVGMRAAQGQSLEDSKSEKGNAGNHDTNTEVTVSSDQVANPIERSITAYQSGWASFFSSRRLIVKRLGYSGSTAPGDAEDVNVKRDENGVEIMEVDFDEDATSAEGNENKDQNQKLGMDGSSKVKGIENSGQVVKAAVGSSTTMGSTKASRDGDEKPSQQSHPTAPPLTTSEDIKQETAQSIPSNVQKGKPIPRPKPASGSTTPIPRPSTPTGQGVPDPSLPSAPTPPPVALRGGKRTASPTPSSKKIPPPPNLVLPTWEDTFHVPPRSLIPPLPTTAQGDDDRSSGRLLGRAMGFVSGVLFSKDGSTATSPGTGSKAKLCSGVGGEDHNDENISASERERRERFQHFGKELPHAWDVVERANVGRVTHPTGDSSIPSKAPTQMARHAVGRLLALSKDKDKDGGPQGNEQTHVHDILRGCRRVVVIGVHGWFPGAVVRTVLGEPTGTSGKFVNMMVQALENFQDDYGVSLEKITRIPLEGEGTIERRVERLYNNLTANQEWMDDLHAADAIFVATHSQGSVVSTHLLNRLIRDRHIRTSKSSSVISAAASSASAAGVSVVPVPKLQKVCCLALCGIHLGPLRYLSSSTFFQPYIQYFESGAARELFEFQNTESAVSKSYVSALRHVLDNGVKMVYVASLNDQVVPIYSGLFTAVSHPLILRALYIDGDAYHSSDFLSNLLVLLLRILNSGISDSGLLAHLSEATAGSLSGVGHSTAYEEIATYSLAVKYLFLTNDGLADHSEATLDSFNANQEQNDYEIPWALRDVIADEHVAHFFAKDIAELRDAFRDWHPKTTILRDLKRKLQPIQRLPQSFSSGVTNSKL